ncbi:hypothetical protein D3C78_975200 [compost metagenome]
MSLPVQDETLQKVRTAQERAVIGVGTAHDHMVAAAGAGVAAVDHELVGSETRLARFFINGGGDIDTVLPARGGVDVDFDDTGIGRDADDIDTLVMGRRITFDMDG